EQYADGKHESHLNDGGPSASLSTVFCHDHGLLLRLWNLEPGGNGRVDAERIVSHRYPIHLGHEIREIHEVQVRNSNIVVGHGHRYRVSLILCALVGLGIARVAVDESKGHSHAGHVADAGSLQIISHCAGDVGRTGARVNLRVIAAQINDLALSCEASAFP